MNVNLLYFFQRWPFFAPVIECIGSKWQKSRLFILHTSLKGYSSTMRSTLKATLKASVLPSAIPHICPFWYTTTLFRFVKNTPNLRKFAKNSKTGQNYALSMLKCTFALKKYTTAGCVVVTNMSYALDLFLTWTWIFLTKYICLLPLPFIVIKYTISGKISSSVYNTYDLAKYILVST